VNSTICVPRVVANLTNNPAQDREPLFSYDGNHDIYIMNSDGSYVERIKDYPKKETQPTWPCDNKKIVFTWNRDWEE